MPIRWNMYMRDGIASYWNTWAPVTNSKALGQNELAVVTSGGKQKWNRNTRVTLLSQGSVRFFDTAHGTTNWTMD